MVYSQVQAQIDQIPELFSVSVHHHPGNTIHHNSFGSGMIKALKVPYLGKITKSVYYSMHMVS